MNDDSNGLHGDDFETVIPLSYSPKLDILVSFMTLGGIFGAFGLGIVMMGFAVYSDFHKFSLEYIAQFSVNDFFFSAVIILILFFGSGFVIGFVPALLTALSMIFGRLRRVWSVGLAGAFWSAACYLIYIFWHSSAERWHRITIADFLREELNAIIVLSACGAFSAAVLAWGLLRRHPKLSESDQ